jgi:hypothetical protein
MNKLILFTAALLLTGEASAYAQSGDYISDHGATSRHHRRLMSAHAQWRGPADAINYRSREFSSPMIAPPYGDDPEAEGRTSGGG